MAGHSKWHNIKHRKAAVDKKRGKLWSKCSRAIIAAARQGGPDPASNLTLRYAIDEARYANMPRDTIERAIKKGAGEVGGDNWEHVRYEGYGPGGVAILIEGLTDNRTRTVGDLRLAMGRFGGNLGQAGCVGFLFEPKGQILVPAAAATEDQIMEAAIAAGADDVEGGPPEGGPVGPDDFWTIYTQVAQFQAVKDALEAAGIKIEEANLAMLPTTKVEVRGNDAKKLLAMLDAVEDLDDIQKVYANFDIPDEELAALEQ
jgi:YebC/PmpR family DNA-binding regulatory protein